MPATTPTNNPPKLVLTGVFRAMLTRQGELHLSAAESTVLISHLENLERMAEKQHELLKEYVEMLNKEVEVGGPKS